jgi:hypothetical protein
MVAKRSFQRDTKAALTAPSEQQHGYLDPLQHAMLLAASSNAALSQLDRNCSGC